MKARVGKIARLPKDIREQLNQRLENGERASTIIQWLNQLPEVQKILAEQFAGHPVRQQNISEWRKGGYAEWAENRTGLAHWQKLLGHIDELTQERTLANGNDVTSNLGTLVVLELAQAMDQLSEIEDPAKRWKTFRLLSMSLSRLRRDDCREQRIRLLDRHSATPTDKLQTNPTRSDTKKNSFLFGAQPEERGPDSAVTSSM